MMNKNYSNLKHIKDMRTKIKIKIINIKMISSIKTL